MTTLHVLLPSLVHLGDEPWLRRWLPRGDRLPARAAGSADMLGELFQFPATRLPAAALLRQFVTGDAGQDVWVVADPAHVLVEINGARLMACGNLDLSPHESAELACALRPVFGDSGMLIEETTPNRWHLRLPTGAKPPAFDTPEQTLGDDLLDHLPQGDAGRRWRTLFNEAQMILHQHAVNAERKRRGQVPVNALWFWGEGSLPSWVRSSLARVASDDALVLALATAATLSTGSVAAFDAAAKDDGDELLDLRGVAELAPWWPRVEVAWRRHDALRLAFASGERKRLKRWHRWRLWRRGG